MVDQDSEVNRAVSLALVPSVESAVEERFDNGGVISLKDFLVYVFTTIQLCTYIQVLFLNSKRHSISPMEESKGGCEAPFSGQGPQGEYTAQDSLLYNLHSH